MAQSHQTNPRNSCLLGCFGFSMKRKSQQKKTRSFSWLRFRFRFRLSSRKRKTKTKLDSTQASSKPHKPSRQNSKADQRPPFADQVARETPKETRALNGSPSEPTRTGTSLPDSPVPMIKTKPRNTPTRLSHTVTLPVLEGSQRVGNPRIHAPIGSKNLRLKNDELIAKFEPMIGIVVALIIIALWGRLCAILCTSACLYVCPRFRTRSNGNETTADSDGEYLNSKEYKKKVVLEGLLQRNHRFTL
ncbi:hypothetical protein V6N12_005058 [Hibiscus sabdariffa]|uniref:Uncharacterized protein n=2 Tax=Hibiscus sabdariffa TaxID=183260 RepID=A0ABR2CNB8_9ROSI